MKKLQEMKNEQGEQEPMILSTTYIEFSSAHSAGGKAGSPEAFILIGFYHEWFLLWCLLLITWDYKILAKNFVIRLKSIPLLPALWNVAEFFPYYSLR